MVMYKLENCGATVICLKISATICAINARARSFMIGSNIVELAGNIIIVWWRTGARWMTRPLIVIVMCSRCVGSAMRSYYLPSPRMHRSFINGLWFCPADTNFCYAELIHTTWWLFLALAFWDRRLKMFMIVLLIADRVNKLKMITIAEFFFLPSNVRCPFLPLWTRLSKRKGESFERKMWNDIFKVVANIHIIRLSKRFLMVDKERFRSNWT